jgi:GntR family transcriptional regulator
MINLIHIDKRKRTPVYQQISYQIQELILTKRVQDQSLLPSFEIFEKHFDLTEDEFQNIVSYLMQQNLLIANQDRYFVNTPIVSTKVVGRFKGIFSGIEAIGLIPSIQDISIKLVEDVAFSFKGEHIKVEKAWQIERIYLGSNRPLVYYIGYLPYELFPEFNHTNYHNNRIYDVFESDYNFQVSQSVRMIFGKTLNAKEAKTLQYPEGSPAMVVHLLTYNQNNTLIELSKLISLADYLHVLHELD